jgi:hypothetical protein
LWSTGHLSVGEVTEPWSTGHFSVEDIEMKEISRSRAEFEYANPILGITDVQIHYCYSTLNMGHLFTLQKCQPAMIYLPLNTSTTNPHDCSFSTSSFTISTALLNFFLSSSLAWTVLLPLTHPAGPPFIHSRSSLPHMILVSIP